MKKITTTLNNSLDICFDLWYNIFIKEGLRGGE